MILTPALAYSLRRFTGAPGYARLCPAMPGCARPCESSRPDSKPIPHAHAGAEKSLDKINEEEMRTKLGKCPRREFCTYR